MAEVEVLAAYARLSREKEAAEAQIAAIVEELTSGTNPAGVAGPLVDAEGFPRADIDVYRVRHQRHALVCLQNDHKAVMRQIEELLPRVFEARRKQQAVDTKVVVHEPVVAPVTVSEAPATVFVPPVIDAEDRAKEPFAVVENVQLESPAAAAGLLAGDQVLVFGTADARNHRELAAVKEIVARNVGSAIRVLVRRRPLMTAGGESAGEWEWLGLLLTPMQWRGLGMLGCLLMPLPTAQP